MMAIIILAVACTLILVLIKPKWGTFLVWPILFTYPHGWWYYHQFLPLNIGVDDLFCIILFLAVVFRMNILGSVPIRFGYAFWVITLFTVVATIANIFGSREAPAIERILYMKDILKLGIYLGLFYAILHCINDVHDLKLQFYMYSLAAGLGAVIMILQYFYPYKFAIFAAPIVLQERGITFEGRAYGAFMNANVAACVMVCSLAFILTAVRLQKRFITKLLTYCLVFLLLFAVLLTRSRSGLLALAIMITIMAFRGKNKRFALLLIASSLVIAISFPDYRDIIRERLEEIYQFSTGVWGHSAASRLEILSTYIRTTSAKDYLVGQGWRRGMSKTGMSTHNLYLSMLVLYGVGGVVWALFSFGTFFKKAHVLKDSYNPLISMIASGSVWALVAWFIYGLFGDPLNGQYARYLLFYLIVLLDRAYNIAREEQEFLLYNEQINQPVVYADYASIS